MWLASPVACLSYERTNRRVITDVICHRRELIGREYQLMLWSQAKCGKAEVLRLVDGGSHIHIVWRSSAASTACFNRSFLGHFSRFDRGYGWEVLALAGNRGGISLRSCLSVIAYPLQSVQTTVALLGGVGDRSSRHYSEFLFGRRPDSKTCNGRDARAPKASTSSECRSACVERPILWTGCQWPESPASGEKDNSPTA